MNSEKVKEIKKVLEEEQFNTINHHQKEGKSIKISFADILTLINELESENKRLKRSINSIQKGFDNGEFISKDCKISGLKQFAEKLQKELPCQDYTFNGITYSMILTSSMKCVIDKLLKDYGI